MHHQVDALTIGFLIVERTLTIWHAFQANNESLSKEVSLLRKKLDQEQQSYRDAVKAWEASQSRLRTQVEELRSTEAIAEARLQELTAELENTRSQLQASQESTNSAIGGSLPKLADLQAQVRMRAAI